MDLFLPENVQSDSLAAQLAWLRNKIALDSNFRDEVCTVELASDIRSKFVSILKSDDCLKPEDLLCVRRALQVLTNLSVPTDDQSYCSRSVVWKSLFPTDDAFILLKSLLDTKDAKVIEYTGALLFNCILARPVLESIVKKAQSHIDVVETICDGLQSDPNCHWYQDIIEQFLAEPKFLGMFIPLVSEDTLMVLLADAEKMHKSNLCACCTTWINLASSIDVEKGTGSGYIREQARLGLLLMFLCEATAASHKETFITITRNKDLLRSAISLLHKFVELAKAGHPDFTVQKKYAELLSNKEENCSATFALKRELIRLIGNMCYRTPANQMIAAEMDAILFILDSTALDSNNPFITQWAILAVGNICENSPENQQILKSITDKPVSDNQKELLDQLQ